jgi:alpha-D-ribose 1-methylphosphonate 5-triphosphate diphosphatase
MSTVLRSKRVLTKGQFQPADIVIEHDYIVAVNPYDSSGSTFTSFDLGNLLVVPGFVDLHSDAVEKEIEPRPGADFPVENALVELDKKLAMAGITTMFHAIAFNEESLVGQRGTATATNLIRKITDINSRMLAIDNLVHARFEITSLGSLSVIKELLAGGQVQMLSLMDHSPGQGQFRSLEKWKEYHMPVYDLSEQEVQEIVSHQREKKSRCMGSLLELTDCAKELNILIASHDDDTSEKIDLMEGMGITISEFPLNLETAVYARHRKMTTGMGAPNIVRGRSQSGNISARELLQQDCCDFLCSDYHPSSMLQAVYALHLEMGMALASAFSFITSAPAKIARLTDRGEIGPQKLADLAVIDDLFVPKVVLTMKSGNPIYSGSSCFCIHEPA